MKANKELGSSRNEGNKTAKNEINEVFGEEDEGQYNKGLHINMEELKVMCGKQERLWVHSLNRLKNIEPDENENPVCINCDHVDQWREVPQVT